jgi:hypothetical protein
MPNMTFPKSALEPRPAFKPGIYDVMFKGFKPALSKNANETTGERTINLNPELVICNSPETFPDGKPYNGSKVFCSLNLSFLPAVQDFFHAYGEELVENGENVDLPGSFANGTQDPDPKNWGPYSGVILNGIGKVELVEVQANKKVGKTYVPDPTKTRSDIKRWICAVNGCQVQHMESLIRS